MSTKKRALLVAALFAAGCAGVAVGCGWEGIERSVRFGYGLTDRERSRLPPLPFKTGGQERKSARLKDDARLPSKQRAAEVDKLWEEIVAASDSPDVRASLDRERRRLTEYVERTTPLLWRGAWSEPKNSRERRNAAFDRLDALAALDHGASAEAVAHYLAARAAYDAWRTPAEIEAEEGDDASVSWEKERALRETEETRIAAGMRTWDAEVEPHLAALARDPHLADNADYLRAVGVYGAGQPGDSIEAFESVVAKYPRSEKREAALYMAGRLNMELSKSYAGGASATGEEPCREADCRDEAWRRARRDFTRVAAEHPRGRLAADARGRVAYLDLRVGDKAPALVEYYRLLGGACGEEGRDLAVRSLRLARDEANDEEMTRVEAELEDEPEAALAYAYHAIYNYTFNYLALPDDDDSSSASNSEPTLDESRWDEQEETRRRAQAERKELRRVARFAARMLTRYPRAGVGAAFAVRVAAANLELGDTLAARAAARRALSSAPDKDERAKALWLAGAAEYRLKDYAAARATLARLAAEYADGDLAERARVLLATLAEDAGDLAGALEQYLALGYDADAGYFVDVLLTPDQLAAFVAAHPDAPRRDELHYALGLRMMRAGRYPEARAAFARVRTRADSYYNSSPVRYSYGYDESRITHPKLNLREGFFDYDDDDAEPDANAADPARGSRVYADWLLADMQTLDRLEQLQAEIDRAAGDEAKAEAMYQLASYFYEGSLVTYNPAAWRGQRATMLALLGEQVYRSPNEAETVWRHAQEHEAAAHALAVYLEVARLYPQTRAARDALYTATLCHQRLADYNGYWRARYEQGLRAGGREVTLEDLRRTYPDYRLPPDFSFGGWEPSTRTVYGKPAWPAPPKARKLTGMERARLKIKRAELRAAEAWELFGEVAGGRVKRYTVAALRWTLVALVSFTTLLVFRLTRRSRAVLFDLVARPAARRMPTIELLPAQASSYGAHEPYTPPARARAAARDLGRGLFRIILDERGRAALALNLLTHGLLTALLYALMWALRTG